MDSSRILIPIYRFGLIVFIFISSGSAVQAQTNIWLVPKSALNVKNPNEPTATSIKNGKALYLTYCTPCHGKNGTGNGPAAAALNPKPADHTSAKVQAETDGALFYKMSEGRSPMPAYATVLSETQRWDLVNYIRTLAKKK